MCKHNWRVIESTIDQDEDAAEKECYYCTRCLASAEGWFDDEGVRRISIYNVDGATN